MSIENLRKSSENPVISVPVDNIRKSQQNLINEIKSESCKQIQSITENLVQKEMSVSGKSERNTEEFVKNYYLSIIDQIKLASVKSIKNLGKDFNQNILPKIQNRYEQEEVESIVKSYYGELASDLKIESAKNIEKCIKKTEEAIIDTNKSSKI